uniref:Uncharacterized protein n=1 Tax=viral metagenome TaxID=1070528 RepID=A0A6C0FI70_9ZZZZ
MDISIEFVFLFACALFVLHFIISECRYTNVEGYRCGTCPISTAKCPDKCKTIIKNDEWLHCLPGSHTEECGDCEFASGEEPCLDTGAHENLYIGNLDLEIAGDIGGIKYKYNDDKKWYVYTMLVEDEGYGTRTSEGFGDPVEVTDQDKLNTLKKLNSSPYNVRTIGLFHIPSWGFVRGVVRAAEWVVQTNDTPFDYKIGVKSTGHARHLYFSDSAKDAYCLGVPSLSVWDAVEEFPHVVDYNSDKNKLQYIGFAPAMEVGGKILNYC